MVSIFASSRIHLESDFIFVRSSVKADVDEKSKGETSTVSLDVIEKVVLDK